MYNQFIDYKMLNQLVANLISAIMVTDGEKALGLVSIQQFLKVYVSRYTLVHMAEEVPLK